MDYAVERQRWHDLLVDDVLPWWLRHAIDHEHGGICTCIGDDGVIASHDKYIWSQVRAVWTFAAAYNRIARNDAWLEAATPIFRFAADHGRTDEHDWRFLVSRTGELIEGPESIQCDAFALCAMVEYAKATGSDEALAIAHDTYRRTWQLIRQPGSYRTKPYPIPEGAKAQRVSMQFSLAYWELAKLTGDDDVEAAAWELTDDVLENFRRPELPATVEYLSLDNTLLEPPIGTYASAGHGIETAWFQLENLRGRDEPARIAKALDIMRWSFEQGWDAEFGGLLLGMDVRGGEPYLPNADTKIWWPHAEAICGALLAHEACGEPWCEAWYERVRDWSLAHFPDREHGEWTQRLDREGRKLDRVVALPVKDPFHLPRALIYAVETLDRVAERAR